MSHETGEHGVLSAVGAAIVAVLVLAASCSDETVKFSDDDSDGGSGAHADGGQGGGVGASGGEQPFSCSDCEDGEVCVDDIECAPACPMGRDSCQPDTSTAPVCCAAADQCCTAAAHGLPADVCASDTEGCPQVCPDGTTTCNSTQLCELNAEFGTYSCVDECAPQYTCGDVCCPIGATCPAGSCVLADLTIDDAHAESHYCFDEINFVTGSCSFNEGCIDSLGTRRLLRFDLRTPNVGDGDLYLGDPDGNDLFIWGACHGHYHFESYARYRLLDQTMTEVAAGHKQAFCLMDTTRVDNTASPNALYDCGNQGIQRGWADTYTSGLICQWVDITDLAPGDYLLEIVVNGDHVLGETDYTNNSAVVPVTIPAPGTGDCQ